MAATGTQFNWTGVAFASSPIVRVTSVAFDQGGEPASFSGDNDRYTSVMALAISRPTCTITSGDVARLMAIAPGTTGAIAATQKDALGATGGDIVWSLANAMHVTSTDTGQYGQFATATASFGAFAPDGQTNPLSFTRT